jgi:hypothetical protein
MTNKMRLGLIVMAFAMLCLANSECESTGDILPVPTSTPIAILGIVPGDGQVREAVIKTHGTIQDTADDIMDAANATGEGVEIPTEHGTVVIDTFWELALSIAKGG